jgi:hypothetical protein
LLLPPIQLHRWYANGSAVRLCLGPTLDLATRIPEDSACEYDKGLLVRTEVAVPTSRQVNRSAQRRSESGDDVVIHLELDERPRQRLSGSNVTDISPADSANPEIHIIEGLSFERLSAINARTRSCQLCGCRV